jgi:DinB family protein
MPADRSFVKRNAQSRARLRQVVERLTDADLLRPVGAEWTIAVTLAHLGFFDRWVGIRWDRYEQTGILEDLPDVVTELINAAALAEWQLLPSRRAGELALTAAEELDLRLERLSDAAVARALDSNRPFMVDRASHRDAHLDDVERASTR